MRRFLACLAIAFLTSAAGASDDSWSLVRSNNGVETYLNDRTSDGFREFRGVTRMAATFKEARDVIKDIPGNIHWLPSCRRSELIRHISETELLVYIVSTAPWPVHDRDCVWMRHYEVDTEEHFRLVFTASDEEYEGETGLVRIFNARGVWEVKRLTDDTVEVSFQYLGDGGGTVPRSFVNSATKRIPEKALLALYERIEDLRSQ
jgi:START domain